MNLAGTDDLLLASIQGHIFLMELLTAIKLFTQDFVTYIGLHSPENLVARLPLIPGSQ